MTGNKQNGFTTLGLHINTQKGFAFKSQWYSEQGKPLVKVSNFTEDIVDTSDLVCISDDIAENYLRYELKKDDVVIQTVGSWPNNPKSVVGKAIRIPIRASGALLNQNAVKIEPTEELNKKFLFYLLRSDDFKKYIIGTAQGAANQASITLDSIRGYSFRLPKLIKQRKIAAILSAYDDLIENNTRRIKILEEMAQALYREWFVKFRFPGHEKVKMVESELGMVPEGWEVKKLGDIAQQIRRSVNPDKINPTTPYIGLEHIPRKSITLSEWGTANEVKSTKLAFEKGEILFGKIRPYFHKVGVAPIDGVCSSDAIVISSIVSDYFFIVLGCVSSEEFVNHSSQTSQGTKMPRADWSVLVNYPIAIPPQPILLHFNEFINNILSQIQNMVFRNRNLRRTRNLLLPKLISGKVNVDT